MRAQLEKQLNDRDINVRLNALKELKALIDNGTIPAPVSTHDDVNNHIHTTYSFSPYSPAAALYYGYMAGLKTAGIMDHDSVCGAREFIEAGKILDMAVTIGIECRLDFSETGLGTRRFNNPDQDNVAYVTLHGIPHTMIDTVEEFMKPKIAARMKRNAAMIERINKLLEKVDISLDLEKDVIPLSNYEFGGTVTERHILFALSHKIVERFGKGEKVVDFLTNDLNMKISDKIKGFLSDPDNAVYEYDLLGALKSDMVGMIYIDATDECPKVKEFADFAEKVGGVMAYAYLGDVGVSVTGDKKAQKFEDDFLDELFVVLKDMGFKTITYMPSRNTREQILRLKDLCKKFNMFEISGEDINSPRQSFICVAQRDPLFANLVDSTWALIGHEQAATKNLEDAFFSAKTIEKYPVLTDRIEAYKKLLQK